MGIERERAKDSSKDRVGLDGFRDLLLRILDRLSAFCVGMIVEPVRVSATRILVIGLLSFTFLWTSAGEVQDGDPFPPLRADDLPILARGILEENIVLDRSLCDLSEADEDPLDPMIDQVIRRSRRDLLVGEWL